MITTTKTLGAGKDVLSHCNKCKLTLSHTIIAMKDERTPAKVMCNTCKGTHSFKDPNAKKVSSVIKKTATVKSKEPKIKSETYTTDSLWMQAMGETSKRPVTYSIKQKFEQGDILDHPKFGPGVVDKVYDGNKIEVIFRYEIKTLIHNK